MYISAKCVGVIVDDNGEIYRVLVKLPGQEKPVLLNPWNDFVEMPAGTPLGVPVFIRGEVRNDRFAFENPAKTFPDNPELADVPVVPDFRILDEDECDSERFEMSEAYPGQEPLRFHALREILANHFGCRASGITHDELCEFGIRLSEGQDDWVRDALCGMN